MEGVREYLLSVTAAAILAGIISSLTGEKGSQPGLVKLISGLFLCFTVIAPIARIKIADFTDFTSNLLVEGQQLAQDGEDYYTQALRQVITEETRAYILDKARTYGTEIQVTVVVSGEDQPIPESCTIAGNLSPYVRQQLKKVITNDLGIPEENIVWTQQRIE